MTWQLTKVSFQILKLKMINRFCITEARNNIQDKKSIIFFLRYIRYVAIFESGEDFWKLGHKFLTILRDQITLPCASLKNESNTNNFSWYINPGTQFNYERESPEALKFLLGKIKDVIFLFLYHILGLHFLEAIKQ